MLVTWVNKIIHTIFLSGEESFVKTSMYNVSIGGKNLKRKLKKGGP